MMGGLAPALASAADAPSVMRGSPAAGGAPSESFGAVLLSFDAAITPGEPIGLAMPDPQRAAAFAARGLLARGEIAATRHAGNVSGDPALAAAAITLPPPPVVTAPLSLDRDARWGVPPLGTGPVGSLPVDHGQPGSPPDRAVSTPRAPLGDVPLATPPAPAAPHIATIAAFSKATPGSQRDRPIPAPRRLPQAARGMGVAIDLATADGVSTVSVKTSALDDAATEQLADGVRALLARHGLVLGTLRINGRPAAGGAMTGER